MKIGIAHLFESQMVLERMIATLYDCFSEKFTSLPEAQRFWKGLSEEERMHEAAMAVCKNLLLERKAGERVVSLLEIEDIKRDIALLGSYLREARSKSLEEALAITREVESGSAEQRFWWLLRLHEGDLFKELLEEMSEKSTGYHNLLPEFARSLAVSIR